MSAEQVTQIADAINGVKWALCLLAFAVFISEPSMGGIRQALDNIANALRGDKKP